MAKEKWTVFFDCKDAGNQAPATWKEKEVVVKAGEKNSGYLLQEFGKLLTAEVGTCKFVTVEAEGAEEAAEAVRQYYNGGVTNPGKSASAVPVGGLCGGWTNNKVLAAASSNLTEANAYP